MGKSISKAVKRGEIDSVRQMLADGADANAKSFWGSPLLAIAASKDNLDMVKLLLDAGAKPNTTDAFGETALTQAAMNGNAEMVETLLKGGAYQNFRGSGNHTALMRAASGGHTKIVKMLIEARADLDIRDSEDRTALYYAVDERHADVVKLLVEAGANPDIRATEYKRTPLVVAVRENMQDIAETLVRNGAKCDMGDRDGYSALFYAEHKGYIDLALLMRDRKREIADAALPTEVEGFKKEDKVTVSKQQVMQKGKVRLTQVFNFETRQVTTIANDHGAGSCFIRNFEDMNRPELLQKAHDALKAMGGEPPEGWSDPQKQKQPGVKISGKKP